MKRTILACIFTGLMIAPLSLTLSALFLHIRERGNRLTYAMQTRNS